MAKRALVVGSQLRPLKGVHNDVEAMAVLLGQLEFTVDRRIEGDATREGILEGYRRLIADSASGDAAVIYYSGHGGFAVNPNPKPSERERLQCIFPTDWSDTGDFRGILDLELSKWQADLTARTPNVTVILDCCHSAELSRVAGPAGREEGPVPRVYGAVWAESVEEFLADHPLDLSLVHVESNPHAVRVVAAESDRSAYEDFVAIDGDVVRRGLFTYALQQVLSAPGGAALSWRTIVNRVRELVLGLAPMQRPIVEGPADRLVFTTSVLERPDAVVFTRRDGVPLLRASRILGANVGATYHIMPFGVTKLDISAAIATATVAELVGLDARVEVTPKVASAPPPQDGALAFPDQVPYPPVPVHVEGTDPERVRELLRTSRFAVEAPRQQARFVIRADASTIEMLEVDRRAGTPLGNDDTGRSVLLERLARWAKAESVRSLVTVGLPHDAIGLSWGRVENGTEVPHGPGERLHIGESLYVAFSNRGTAPLYVAVFDVGVDGTVTLLTSSSPDGRQVAPKATSYVPRNHAHDRKGLPPMYWPEEVPKDAARRESLVVLATTKATTFTSLETSRSIDRGPSNRLELLLESFREGTARNAPTEDAGAMADGYWVGTIDFELVPSPRTPLRAQLGGRGVIRPGTE